MGLFDIFSNSLPLLQSTITATTTTLSVTEGGDAVASYTLDKAIHSLFGTTNVSVQRNGNGATLGSDYTGFEYRTIANNFETAVVDFHGLANGQTVIIAGRTLTNNKGVDATETEVATVFGGGTVANINLSGTLTNYTAATAVGDTVKFTSTVAGNVNNLTVTGNGLTDGIAIVDGATTTAWANVSNSTVPLAVGTVGFELKTTTLTDTLKETNESVTFVVNQIGQSGAIKDSYYVASTIGITDTVNSVTNPVEITVIPTPGTAPITAAVNGKEVAADTGYAYATFKIGAGTTTTTLLPTSVSVSMVAQGGATLSADTVGGLLVQSTTSNNGTGAWAPLTVTNGAVTIPANTTMFQLYTSVKADVLKETGESITFVANQNQFSVGLTNSYYVASNVPLVDVAPIGISLDGGNSNSAGDTTHVIVQNFSMTAGIPLAVANDIRSITNFGAEDTITLPAAMATANKQNILTVDITGHTWTMDQLVTLYNAVNGTAFENTAGGTGILKLVDGTGTTYLVVDKDADGLYDSTSSPYDLFIKITGAAVQNEQILFA